MSRTKNAFGTVLMVLALTGLGLLAAEQAGTLDKYLSAADIQGVSGFSGVKLSQSVPRNLHFADKDGHAILVAKFLRSTIFNKSDAAKMGLVKAEVKGIGEDAYYGPNVDTPYILTFKKGEFCVELSTLFNAKDNRAGKLALFLSMDQLEALGKIIASRI